MRVLPNYIFVLLYTFVHLTALSMDGPPEIQQAIRQEEPDKAIKLIKNAAKNARHELSAFDAFGEAPIHAAAKKGSLKVLRCLLDLHVDVNLKTKYGKHKTAFMLAYSAPIDNSQEVLSLLMEYGADINFNDLEQKQINRHKSTMNIGINAPRQEFLAYVEEGFKQNNKEFIALLPYIYPMHITERHLFILLKTDYFKQYLEASRSFLHHLAEESFPNGLKYMSEAAAEFKALIQDIAPDDMQQRLIIALSSKTRRNSITEGSSKARCTSPRFDPESFDFLKADMKALAHALTYRDIEILRNINLGEFRTYLIDKSYSNEINALLSHTDKTVHWFVYQVLKERDPKKQYQALCQLVKLGLTFYYMDNFQGLFQVFSALEKPFFKEIKSKKENLKKMNEFSKQALELIIPSRNFAAYRTKAETLLSLNQPMLPWTTTLFLDLTYAHELYESVPSVVNLTKIGAFNKEFLRRKALLELYDLEFSQPYLNLVKNLPTISEQTLDILAELRKPPSAVFGLSIKKSERSRDVLQWDSNDFVSWLLEKHLDRDIQLLFDHQIWDGSSLEQVLDNFTNDVLRQKRLHEMKLSTQAINELVYLYNQNKLSAAK